MCVSPGGAGRDWRQKPGGCRARWPWGSWCLRGDLLVGGHGEPFRRKTGMSFEMGGQRRGYRYFPCPGLRAPLIFSWTSLEAQVPGFSLWNSCNKDFREQKLPVFVLGLFSGVLHKIMCLETQFSFQRLVVKLGFKSRWSWISQHAEGLFSGVSWPDSCSGV